MNEWVNNSMAKAYAQYVRPIVYKFQLKRERKLSLCSDSRLLENGSLLNMKKTEKNKL